MSIGPTVGPAVRPAIRGAMGYKRTPEAVIRGLFSEGQQGFWLPFTDFASLTQDAAGTLPYTALEQPVGLILDKSKGGGRGPELSPNGGTFDDAAGWTITDPTSSISGGVLNVGAGACDIFPSTASVVVGKSYEVTFTISNSTANYGIRILNRDIIGTGDYFPAGGQYITANGSYRFVCVASSNGSIGVNRVSGHTGSLQVDNFSVKEIPGNHASQVTSTARGVVSARVNALLNTDNPAAWGYAGTGFSVGSKDVDDGWPLTALINSASALAAVNTDYPIGASGVADATIVRSIELQAGTASFVRFGAASTTDAVVVDLVTKAIVYNLSALPVTIVPLADNWVRVEIWSSRASFNATLLSNYLAWGLSQSGGVIDAAGQIGSTIKVRKPSYSRQALGYTAPVPYQRVGAKYNCLINTEDFSKYQLGDASVVSNTHLAPDGTMTADSLTLYSPSSYANNSFLMGLVSVGQAVTASVFSLSATNVLYLGGATPTGTDTLQSIDVGAGWYRHWVTRVFTESRVGALQLLVSGFAPAGVGVKVVWGTQAVFGADPLPYEAVNTASDYDSIGFPKYLRLDGTDDFYTCGGGGSTTGFYYSDVIKPTSATFSVLIADNTASGGYLVERTNTGIYFSATGGGTTRSVSLPLAVNVQAFVCAFDDGVNLVLQVNGAQTSIARPAVTAGSATMYLWRYPTVAQFFSGQATEPIYRAGPPPSAYERDVIRNYQMQKAGML